MFTTNQDASLYFIAVIPPDEIEAELYGLKQEVAKKFQSKKALNSPAHITLHMPFKKKDAKMGTVLTRLNELAESFTGFECKLDGFSCFPPRVIYVDVTANEELVQLQKGIFRSMKLEQVFNANYKDRPFHPHVTIAFRDFKKSAFYPAWDYYKDQQYVRNFRVTGFTLLKHNGQRWERFKEFWLGS
jgi:2'-5' RNA ligase